MRASTISGSCCQSSTVDAGYKAGMTRILYEGHNRAVGPAMWIDTPAKEGDVWKNF